MIDYAKQVELGRTGLRISRIVVGTSGFGGFQSLPEWPEMLTFGETLVQRFGRAITWDTANMYGAGMALENLGKLIRRLGCHTTSTVINKPGWVIVEPIAGVAIDNFEPGLWRGLTKTIRYAQTRAQMRESIDQALHLLGHGIHAPLCSAHDFHKLQSMLNNTPHLFLGDRLLTTSAEKLIYDELLPALAEKRSEGVISALGLGMKNWKLMQQIVQRTPTVDYVMLANEFSLLRHDEQVVTFTEWLRERSIGLIVAAPFHAGWIFGRGEKIDGLIEPTSEQLQWREKFLALCNEHDVQPAAAAIQFVFSNPNVDAVAPGVVSAAQIAMNFPQGAVVPARFWERLIDGGVIRKDYHYLELLVAGCA